MERLGPYHLIKKIDEGGMAELFFAALDKGHNVRKYIVVKRLFKKFVKTQRLLSLFIHEAKINVGFNHPNVVSFFDFGQTDDTYFVAMELIEGLNLKEIVRKIKNHKLEGLEYSDIVYIISEAAKGLSYVHQHKDLLTQESLNILHRDISTDNIMVDKFGTVKVIDFGISTSTSFRNSKKEDGKLPYMSPEQANGDNVDQRSEVFSLGAILWELLAERRLYNGRTIDDIKNMAQNAVVTNLKTIRDDLPNDLIDIVQRSLTKTPQDRFQSMSEFQVSLKEFLNLNAPKYNTKNLQMLVELLYFEKGDLVLEATEIEALNNKIA